MKPCMRSLISCMRCSHCSVYVHHNSRISKFKALNTIFIEILEPVNHIKLRTGPTRPYNFLLAYIWKTKMDYCKLRLISFLKYFTECSDQELYSNRRNFWHCCSFLTFVYHVSQQLINLKQTWTVSQNWVELYTYIYTYGNISLLLGLKIFLFPELSQEMQKKIWNIYHPYIYI